MLVQMGDVRHKPSNLWIWYRGLQIWLSGNRVNITIRTVILKTIGIIGNNQTLFCWFNKTYTFLSAIKLLHLLQVCHGVETLAATSDSLTTPKPPMQL